MIASAVAAGCDGPAPTAKPASAKLPAVFPKNFPIYPGSRVVDVDYTLDRGGQTELRVKFQAPGKPGDAFKFFIHQLPAHGWKSMVLQDLQTKLIHVWPKQREEGSKADRLIISPVDTTDENKGMFIGVVITL